VCGRACLPHVEYIYFTEAVREQTKKINKTAPAKKYGLKEKY
jgi:hypothetical protein